MTPVVGSSDIDRVGALTAVVSARADTTGRVPGVVPVVVSVLVMTSIGFVLVPVVPSSDGTRSLGWFSQTMSRACCWSSRLP